MTSKTMNQVECRCGCGRVVSKRSKLGYCHGHYPYKGFAALSQERRKAIASAGGVAAHAKGTANVFNSEEASRAGKISAANQKARRRGAKRAEGTDAAESGDSA